MNGSQRFKSSVIQESRFKNFRSIWSPKSPKYVPNCLYSAQMRTKFVYYTMQFMWPLLACIRSSANRVGPDSFTAWAWAQLVKRPDSLWAHVGSCWVKAGRPWSCVGLFAVSWAWLNSTAQGGDGPTRGSNPFRLLYWASAWANSNRINASLIHLGTKPYESK